MVEEKDSRGADPGPGRVERSPTDPRSSFALAAAVVEVETKLPHQIRGEIIAELEREQIPEAVLEVLAGIEDETRRIELTVAIEAVRCSLVCLRALQGQVTEEIKTSPAGLSQAERVKSLADDLSSRILTKIFEERFPGYGQLDEEAAGSRLEARKCWIKDPLDGTNAFLRGHLWWAVGVALDDLKDKKRGGSGIIFGVVATPEEGMEIRFGGKELGTWDWQGREVHTSTIADEKQMHFSVGSRDVRTPDWIAALQVMGVMSRRLIAGLDTQYMAVKLASGQIEFMVRVQQPAYDIAPLIGIVEGAGGRVLELNGRGVVIERHLRRIHSVLAWNGTGEVRDFFETINAYHLDSYVAVPVRRGVLDWESQPVKWIEVLRSGRNYETACLLPRREDADGVVHYLVHRRRRFGPGSEDDWDFPLSKGVTVKEAEEFYQEDWRSVFELNDISREIGADYDLKPQGQQFHPAQMTLLGELDWPGGVEKFTPGITRGYEVVGVNEQIPENLFFPQGGRNRETAYCAVFDVPSGVEVVPGNGFGDERWVTREELAALAREGTLSQRLQTYLESPRFDKEFEPREPDFEEFRERREL